MVMCVIDKTSIRLVQSLHQPFPCAFLVLMQASLRVCLVEEVRAPAASVDPAEQPIPPQKSIISSEAPEVYRIDVLMQGLIIELVVNTVGDVTHSGTILCFFGKLASLFEFLPHALFNGALADEVELEHGLLDADWVAVAQAQSGELMVPDGDD